MRPFAILLAPVALTATLAASAAPPPRVVTARINEVVHIHGIRTRPLHVIEDSRCPKNVRCVWAGQVRLLVRMGGVTREFILGKPVPITGGTVQLAAVLPERKKFQQEIDQSAYRFGFLFQSTGRIEPIELEGPPPAGEGPLTLTR